MKALLLALLASFAASAAPADAPTPPARDPGYDALAHFVGRWTTKGSEATFVETCEWFDGRFHVVCRSERKRPDGTTGRGLSILGFVPGEGYVYSGIGNKAATKRWRTASSTTTCSNIDRPRWRTAGPS